MATYTKLLNGLTDLGIHKMQEHLDYYIDMVNKGQKSFSEALEELVDIDEYSCAVKPLVRQTGNRLSGPTETANACLLAQ